MIFAESALKGEEAHMYSCLHPPGIYERKEKVAGDKSRQPKGSQARGKVRRLRTHGVLSFVHWNDSERETLKYNHGYYEKNKTKQKKTKTRKITCFSNCIVTLLYYKKDIALCDHFHSNSENTYSSKLAKTRGREEL